MAEFTKYEPGTPVWVDLGAKDVGAAAKFYSELFGWSAEDMGEEAGHYTMFTLRGKNVAAAGPLMDEKQPVAWSTYLATADADATARKVKEAGGSVLSEPFDVMDAGRMAVFLDPTGAAVLAWQANKHIGAQLANEPNTLTWNELVTDDLDKAKDFYTKAFGLDYEVFPGGGDYTLLKVEGKVVGGMRHKGDETPKEVPNHWNTIFAVADTDATVATAEKLGGKVVMPPEDMPGVGRFAAVADPQGATFGVMTPEGDAAAQS